MPAIKVMIVDDSAVVRQVLAAKLTEHAGIEVIGAAPDPIFALEKMKHRWPDVIVLDVEMPRMDGISFLKKIMAERPTPVVICSTLTAQGAETTLQALAAGAVGIVTKPRLSLKQFLMDSSADLIQTVRMAARANVAKLAGAPAARRAGAAAPAAGQAMVCTTEMVVAIGTSTGGTLALETVLTTLPRTCPGLVIVQHMPEKFTGAFAARLDGLCEIEVREAQDGDRVLPGSALIAPGGRHMRLKRSGAQYQVEVVAGPPVSRHCPSVDVLFRSVAQYAGRNALGIIMTGMGADGALGMKEMHGAGARTIAQDEDSCVVFGMPKEAIRLEAVDRVLPLHAISAAITGARAAMEAGG